MYMIFSDKVKKLGAEIEPFIEGRKGAEENFAPIFKEDAPIDIQAKYSEYVRLIKEESSI